MSNIKLSRISNKSKTSGPVISGITTFTGTQSARLPIGDNSERVGIESGSLRYNDTAGLLEFYDGETWNFIIPAEESANAIGVFGGGIYNTYTQTMEYITISTLGNSKEFGNLQLDRAFGIGACASSTRGIFGAGYGDTPYGTAPNDNYNNNIIEYITFSTKGNSTDFGDLITGRWGTAACSSSTRGVFGAGFNYYTSPARLNSIEYITIATTGNANSFGSLNGTNRTSLASCSSSTRGIFAGGYSPTTNVIDYITIASQGTNATDFGDLIFTGRYLSGLSSNTRGIFGGGIEPYTDTIQYITIASIGDATNFGDLTQVRAQSGACSSSTRGVFAGSGWNDGNSIEYITIATTGNGLEFGELIVERSYFSACSNNHGGLL